MCGHVIFLKFISTNPLAFLCFIIFHSGPFALNRPVALFGTCPPCIADFFAHRESSLGKFHITHHGVKKWIIRSMSTCSTCSQKLRRWLGRHANVRFINSQKDCLHFNLNRLRFQVHKRFIWRVIDLNFWERSMDQKNSTEHRRK